MQKTQRKEQKNNESKTKTETQRRNKCEKREREKKEKKKKLKPKEAKEKLKERKRKTSRHAEKVNETGGEACSSRLTTKSVINNNKNLASLHLLQTGSSGLWRSITLMYYSTLARRDGTHSAELYLLVHSDHSTALQPD